jgi:hypothetical protein
LVIKAKKADFFYNLETSGTLEAVNSLNIACPDVNSDVTVQKLIPEGKQVKSGDTICILVSRPIESYYNEALKQAEVARAEYNKAEASLNLQCLLLESQAQSVDAETKIKKLDSVQSKFVSDVQKKVIDLQIKKAIIEKEKVVKKVEFLKRINASELEKLKLRITQADNRASQAKDRLSKLTLITNVNGIVQYAINRVTGKKICEGDVIWDNISIITIPSLDQMQVKLAVNETSFKRIEVNQKTSMILDAFPEIKLFGVVTKKAAVGTQISRNSQIKMFDVYISVDSATGKITPGLSVTCNIEVSKEKNVLTIPVTSLFEDDSSKYVYLAIKSRFMKKKVTVGDINNNEAIIIKGLKENQLIAQVKPPENLIIQTK